MGHGRVIVARSGKDSARVQHVSKNGRPQAKNALNKILAPALSSNRIYPASGKVSPFCHEDRLR